MNRSWPVRNVLSLGAPMSRLISPILAALAVAIGLATPAAAFGQSRWDKYVDEKYRTVDVSAATAEELISELRVEIQKVLDAGPLAPHRCVFADTLDDMYFMYWQPGRIITTLAAA